MVEGEDSSIDTLMYRSTSDNSNVQRVLVPVALEEHPIRSTQQLAEPGPTQFIPEHDPINYTTDQDHSWPDNIDPVQAPTTDHSRDRWFYMKEFVARVDGILEAMQDKEALPDEYLCTNCNISAAQWRCKECVGCNPLCRKCMRQTHFAHPFHRIEFWTGSHFRPASLWEVGVYLMLPHRQEPSMCPTLTWQKGILEGLQAKKDHHPVPSMRRFHPATTRSADPVPNTEHEGDTDDAAMRLLEQLFDGDDPDQMMEDLDVSGIHNTNADVLDDEVGGDGFQEYMSGPGPGPGRSDASNETPDAPSRDGLSNQYIRVVHTNGIHHLSLVICSCRTHDEVFYDLIHAEMVATSFIKIRTIFTTAVLDRFRCCNLEMKSSAYQFFQLLRRITNPLNPSQVSNLYHELRRLSRLWRWVKKLRWAGYGQKAGQHAEPEPGALGNFCPACPQIGINVPDDWTNDPNPWVFRRVFTADGNFKADHVRQKAPADDIWLYDGLGMTARRTEYASFIETAEERKTVSILHGPDPGSG